MLARHYNAAMIAAAVAMHETAVGPMRARRFSSECHGSLQHVARDASRGYITTWFPRPRS